MNKHLTLVAALVLTGYASTAQNAGSGATQTMKMDMAEVVSASLFGNGPGSPPPVVELPINGTGALTTGIESPEIQVTLQCNSAYDVSVSCTSPAFTYAGPNQGTQMLVADVLSIMISSNNTGGNIGSGFSQYGAITGTTPKVAIASGQPGSRTFGFKYKANPGFNYPAGTYTAEIVYTVTKK